MSEPKKLIEVVMPIKEISAESVRDKSIRHGHISTLHLWWARRPLPVSRAVVFASLVPDPLDPLCPKPFQDAVEILLGEKTNIGDPYKPYLDIPWTSVIDPMEDNLRNRIQMFIGKFTEEMQQHLLNQKPKPESKNQLSDYCLIKWESKNNPAIIEKAQQLIWVAHNSSSGSNKLSANELIEDFVKHINDIKSKEKKLYSIINRHTLTTEIKNAEIELQTAIETFLNKMPKTLDPFAGGGAIPLEAARLGCRSFGNDINPVAHIIQIASLTYPQKFGKKLIITKKEFIKKYGADYFNKKFNELNLFNNDNIEIENILSFDVKYYADVLLEKTKNDIEGCYQKIPSGDYPLAYYWVRVAQCSNPTCNTKVPLLKGFYLVDKPNKKIYLQPLIEGNKISFKIAYGQCELEPWVKRNSLKCPCCNNITDEKDIKKQFIDKKIEETILCYISQNREYIISNENVANKYSFDSNLVPNEILPQDTSITNTTLFGYKSWGNLFNDRQKLYLTTLVKNFKDVYSNTNDEYKKAIATYIGILIDRIVVTNTSFGVWHTSRETVERPMSRQALFMVFDYPEVYPFSNQSGGCFNQIDWIIKYIESESSNSFYTICNNATSGDKNQFENKFLNAVITDPPYYDAIAYADISDFFYVWLKKTLGDIYPINFATPQTPKTDECTALKHHHEGSVKNAKNHFENKLLQIFDALEYQTADLVSIMFAHQSTEAWTTLCNSILGARMNITGSWATDTELTSALKKNISALSSSVTVSCKPSQKSGIGNYRDVKKAIEFTVSKEVEKLYRLGFRGSDLLTACFGQAVSEFGKYEKVEKADGSEVTVAELLEMARESAFNSLLKGFSGDDFTKFYIGWLQLNSLVDTAFDDAAKFTKVGLSIDVQDLFKEHILIKNGNMQHLGSYKERINENNKLGEGRNNSIIDQTHKLMHLYNSPNRNNLLKYIDTNSFEAESPVWRVLTSLAELLPKDIEDYKLAIGLLTNKDQLIREAKSSITQKPEQSQLTFE